MSGIARQISAQNTSKVSVLIMQSCPHAWVRLRYLPVQQQLPYILPFFQIVTVAVVFSFSNADIKAAPLVAAEAKDFVPALAFEFALKIDASINTRSRSSWNLRLLCLLDAFGAHKTHSSAWFKWLIPLILTIFFVTNVVWAHRGVAFVANHVLREIILIKCYQLFRIFV